MLSNKIESVMVHSSNPNAPIGSRLDGAGFSISSGVHLPLYSGFLIFGAVHGPQPCSSQNGLGIFGASHSPSSSSSQYSGFTASGSGMYASASSSQSSGLEAVGSTIKYGASSSQSSGFLASGSGIISSSTQSAGFSSFGSSISFGGVRSKYLESSSEPALATSPLIRISKSWLGLMIRVYKEVVLTTLPIGGVLRCFSSYSPVTGFFLRIMKCTLLDIPHLSGPNMTW
ncbi:hypothetical protein OGAPHI_003932 [Ogataea philodendri]|uniref:Uncharacterized protein n=1 Tax=Ogataea philodendri TaxID=1378263 RepID=A0A9P8P6U5_9ASCO|nr:uncharacterized protein OGAPHI_003932 [Ogataea philodendri]KAH3665744.1 hypothetical protein OGAPHI_003932 [Ogataea philodendri]